MITRPIALLLLTLGVSFASVTLAQPEPDPGVDHCEDYDNEPWFGGTDVHCEYDCKAAGFLWIQVKTADYQFQIPEVRGDTTCGGVTAECGWDPGTCASKVCRTDDIVGTANTAPAAPFIADETCDVPYQNEDDVDCAGYSNEAFDSGLSVLCANMGLGTEGVCPPLIVMCLFWNGHPVPLSDFTKRCSRQIHLPAAELASLLSDLPQGAIYTFVVARTTPQGIAWLQSDGLTCSGRSAA